MNGVIDRCPTGIVGFDKLCDGGFVRNSDNLIVGGPGSGKSTFLLQFLWNGIAKFGENGLYCSFEPDILDTLNDSMAHGWDFSKLSEEGKIKFMRFAPQTSIEELKKELTRMISKNNVRRICFDPVSVLALSLSDKGKIRQTIFELSSLMKRLKVTTIFADESLEGEMNWTSGSEWTKTDILRFLSDSVSIFYESPVAGVGDRAIRIAKMRRTAHERAAIGMIIRDGGIEVFNKEGRVVSQVERAAVQKVDVSMVPKVISQKKETSSPVEVIPKREDLVAPVALVPAVKRDDGSVSVIPTAPIHQELPKLPSNNVAPQAREKTAFSSSNVVT